MIFYEVCDICPERRIGVIQVNGLVFCSDCEKREVDHNIKMVEKIFSVCEYRKENGYMCSFEGRFGHFCGDKKQWK